MIFYLQNCWQKSFTLQLATSRLKCIVYWLCELTWRIYCFYCPYKCFPMQVTFTACNFNHHHRQPHYCFILPLCVFVFYSIFLLLPIGQYYTTTTTRTSPKSASTHRRLTAFTMYVACGYCLLWLLLWESLLSASSSSSSMSICFDRIACSDTSVLVVEVHTCACDPP